MDVFVEDAIGRIKWRPRRELEFSVIVRSSNVQSKRRENSPNSFLGDSSGVHGEFVERDNFLTFFLANTKYNSEKIKVTSTRAELRRFQALYKLFWFSLDPTGQGDTLTGAP